MGRKVAAVTAKEGYETVREKVRAIGPNDAGRDPVSQ